MNFIYSARYYIVYQKLEIQVRTHPEQPDQLVQRFINCIPQTLAASAFVSHRCVRLVSRHLLSGCKYFLARGSPMGLGNLPPHTAPRSRHTAPRSDCLPSTLSAHMQILHLRIHSRVSPHTNHQLRICYVMLVWCFFPLEVGQSPDDVVQCVSRPRLA